MPNSAQKRQQPAGFGPLSPADGQTRPAAGAEILLGAGRFDRLGVGGGQFFGGRVTLPEQAQIGGGDGLRAVGIEQAGGEGRLVVLQGGRQGVIGQQTRLVLTQNLFGRGGLRPLRRYLGPFQEAFSLLGGAGRHDQR